jgi:hypothetical protein
MDKRYVYMSDNTAGNSNIDVVIVTVIIIIITIDITTRRYINLIAPLPVLYIYIYALDEIPALPRSPLAPQLDPTQSLSASIQVIRIWLLM